jgi:putative tryptophan/tyrosine transport system substrate-binding protein
MKISVRQQSEEIIPHKKTARTSMTKKIFCHALIAMLLGLSAPATAQQPARIPRIGYVSGTGSSSNPGPYVEALRQGLRDLGHVDGKNIVIEYRGAEGRNDPIPSLVNELVQLKVDVLVVPVLPAIRAAKQATKTIPIVMVTQADPVATGIIDSLARPGGNITGLATLSRELSGKRLELVKEVVPRISRVAVLRDADSEGAAMSLKEYEAVALSLKMPVQSLEVRGPKPDLEGAFQSAVKGRASALITITTSPLFRRQKQIADLAAKSRLPSMFEGSTWVESGGLMSYSTDDLAVYRRAAVYVDKILKGAKPADIPVEQPTKFEFVINLKTAKALNLTIPQSVLFRADRVIR